MKPGDFHELHGDIAGDLADGDGGVLVCLAWDTIEKALTKPLQNNSYCLIIISDSMFWPFSPGCRWRKNELWQGLFSLLFYLRFCLYYFFSLFDTAPDERAVFRGTLVPFSSLSFHFILLFSCPPCPLYFAAKHSGTCCHRTPRQTLCCEQSV